MTSFRDGRRPPWARRVWHWAVDGSADALIAREARRGRDFPGWVWEAQDRVEKAVKWLLCVVFGHEPVPDQCLRPEHDLCLWCLKRMPGAVGLVRRKGIDGDVHGG